MYPRRERERVIETFERVSRERLIEEFAKVGDSKDRQLEDLFG
jgi:hypothetical protein